MSTFKVGDEARSRSGTLVVEVLEVGTCGSYYCDSDEVIRFVRPDADSAEWAHAAEFEKAHIWQVE